MQRLHPDTESESAGWGQLSVIPVTTRPVHSLSALNASFNPLIGNDEYAPNPSSPANKDDGDQGKSFLKYSIKRLKWKGSTPPSNE